jgi:hypothetical protein
MIRLEGAGRGQEIDAKGEQNDEIERRGPSGAERYAMRHGVSFDAVEHLLMAVLAGQTTQAQFNHPDLGGMGQWSQGGMIMVGDMFNNGLKAKVDGLCSELANLARSSNLHLPAQPAQSQSQYQGGGVSLFVPGGFSSGNWWPQELGHAASTGTQNDLRYAFFPSTRRLAINLGGHITVYDTRDHQIGGFSQQQGGDQSLSFNSQYGLVRVADLDIVQPIAGLPSRPRRSLRRPHPSMPIRRPLSPWRNPPRPAMTKSSTRSSGWPAFTPRAFSQTRNSAPRRPSC